MRFDVSRETRFVSLNWTFAKRPGCGTDNRMSHNNTAQNADDIPDKNYRGYRARAGNQTLRSWTVGGLPIINHLLDRIGLEDFLEKHLPKDDPRLEIPTRRGLLLLVKNILLSREPIYGIGEWVESYAPDLLDLKSEELKRINDDRIGRCLDRWFDAPIPELVLDVVRHVIDEFDLRLDELHNDSTTVSFFGAYDKAAEEGQRRGRKTLAVTYGHSKDHRPDLKQLLYILTVTEDGGVPIYFTSASGNVTDDTTHRETWNLLRDLVGRPDFLYVADCKLASRDNLQYLHNQGGRFVTILPRTRREDAEFRRRLIDDPEGIVWEPLYEVTNERDEVIDRLQVCGNATPSAEGFRLLWFHSTRKVERDASARTRAIDRTQKDLDQLQDRLHAVKTRFRKRVKVEKAVEEILAEHASGRWVRVEIHERQEETFKQARRGRPSPSTRYVRQVSTRFSLTYSIDSDHVAQDARGDGAFPLITNQWKMTPEALLRAYKRQPLIEKRFSQFKTDFEVSPVYLKEVSRIQSLLGVYFFALLVQTLLERELRRAMAAESLESLPLYPEGRSCRAPTTRRVLDLFEPLQRHELRVAGESQDFMTELSPVQRKILNLLGLSARNYGR
jgi:transposase